MTVQDAADSLRRKLAVEGARKSYLDGCESMQRVHIVPGLDNAPLRAVIVSGSKRLARRC